ncbi:MAG: sialate O-acetylesterase [Ginsengibacter sp.]
MRKAKLSHWLIIVCLLLSNSCQKGFETPEVVTIGIPEGGPIGTPEVDTIYDVILLMGQSNTLAGEGLISSFDGPDLRVDQLGRFDTSDYKVVPATEPLQNNTPEKGCVGFALTFAKLYAAQKLEKGREVLIIPCGAVTTGFGNQHWNRGNDLYQDAVDRTNFVLDHFPGSKLKCFLWHQGESDVSFGAADYEYLLETMIKGLYLDIKTKSVDSIPFILGGFVPYWVNTYQQFRPIDSVLRNEPTRLPVAGFADPEIPFVIKKPDDTVNAIHFDANGQREMGKRYFAEYVRLIK